MLELEGSLTRTVASARQWLAAVSHGLDWSAKTLVVALSPSTYSRSYRQQLAVRLYLQTMPILGWFTFLCALVTLVLTRIVVVTAQSYGLSNYALQLVVRVLVLELIPLSAPLFVLFRSTGPRVKMLAPQPMVLTPASGPIQGEIEPQVAHGLHQRALLEVVAVFFASMSLAALSCVVSLLFSYLAVYGFTFSAWPAYTRMFGQVFNPAVTLIFVLKTLLFSLAVALIPAACAVYDATSSRSSPPSLAFRGWSAVLLVILLLEVVSLVGNYY